MQSEDPIGHEKTRGAKSPAQQMRERFQEQCRRRVPLPLYFSQHADGLDGHARCAQAESSANGGDQRTDQRMQMKVLVRVAMIEGQPRGAKRLELCGDFGRRLAARLPVEGYDG